jgi:hypothetical protein
VSRDWRHRPGYAGFEQLRRRKRPLSTAKQYDGKVRFWLRFNEEGDGEFSYDPLGVTYDKFDLFAGWLLGDAEHGVPGESQDKDLNGFRSALNRFFADEGLGRPLLGVEVERTIKDYYSLQILSKQLRGEEAGLERVPCPEGLFEFLLALGERAIDSDTLAWVGSFFLQLLGWLRGSSVGGFQAGDVRFDLLGNLVLSIRKMKMRPHFAVQPGLISIPPATTVRHIRSRVFAVLRRAFAANRHFYLITGRTVVAGPSWPAPGAVPAGADRAAIVLTQQLRRVARPYIDSLPAGQMVASHSWREMAAVACWRARYDPTRMIAQGFWNKVDTMFSGYIKPFVSVFPHSPLLAGLFDWLRTC